MIETKLKIFVQNYILFQAIEEMKRVFTPELAYLSYIPLCKYLGSKYMEETLSNHDLLRSLCLQFDENTQADHAAQLSLGGIRGARTPLDTNVVAVIGNRIDIQVRNRNLHQIFSHLSI